MNVTFSYPPTLQLTQIDPQVVALFDPSHHDMAEKMLIYSTTNTNINDIQLPFPVIGTLSQAQPVQMSGFRATMKVYTSQVAGIEQLLFLQRDQQIFAIRFPANKALAPSIVKHLLHSVNTLH